MTASHSRCSAKKCVASRCAIVESGEVARPVCRQDVVSLRKDELSWKVLHLDDGGHGIVIRCIDWLDTLLHIGLTC